MDNLKQLKNEEIVDLIKSGKVEVAKMLKHTGADWQNPGW